MYMLGLSVLRRPYRHEPFGRDTEALAENGRQGVLLLRLRVCVTVMIVLTITLSLKWKLCFFFVFFG